MLAFRFHILLLSPRYWPCQSQRVLPHRQRGSSSRRAAAHYAASSQRPGTVRASPTTQETKSGRRRSHSHYGTCPSDQAGASCPPQCTGGHAAGRAHFRRWGRRSPTRSIAAVNATNRRARPPHVGHCAKYSTACPLSLACPASTRGVSDHSTPTTTSTTTSGATV